MAMFTEYNGSHGWCDVILGLEISTNEREASDEGGTIGDRASNNGHVRQVGTHTAHGLKIAFKERKKIRAENGHYQ